MKTSSIIDRVKVAQTHKEVLKLVSEGLDYPFISTNTRHKLAKASRKRVQELELKP